MRMERIHQGVANDVERLKYGTHVRVCPFTSVIMPPPKKKKRNDTDIEDTDTGSDTEDSGTEDIADTELTA